MITIIKGLFLLVVFLTISTFAMAQNPTPTPLPAIPLNNFVPPGIAPSPTPVPDVLQIKCYENNMSAPCQVDSDGASIVHVGNNGCFYAVELATGVPPSPPSNRLNFAVNGSGGTAQTVTAYVGPGYNPLCVGPATQSGVEWSIQVSPTQVGYTSNRLVVRVY